MIRLFDRPLGQNLLALACAAILVVGGISERTKDPPPARRAEPGPEDDEPTVWLDDDAEPRAPRDPADEPTRRTPAEDRTQRLPADTEPLPPPEFDPRPSDRDGPPAGGDPHEEQTDAGGDELEGGRDQDRLR